MPTILLVEDDEITLYTVDRFLRGNGFAVITASNGLEGLRAFRGAGGKIDLLLTDVDMPEMNGMDFHAQIEREQPGIPVLFITAGTKPAFALLQKPFSLDELLAHVYSALDGKTKGHAAGSAEG